MCAGMLGLVVNPPQEPADISRVIRSQIVVLALTSPRRYQARARARYERAMLLSGPRAWPVFRSEVLAYPPSPTCVGPCCDARRAGPYGSVIDVLTRKRAAA